MKLGVSFNVFDGDELLQQSILQIRKHADYIVAVAQSISNSNEEYAGGLATCLELRMKGLIDHVITYEPDFKSGGTGNEIAKRNVGIRNLKTQNCSHYLLADCDEYYDSNQFAIAKKLIDNTGYDSTCCHIQSYHKKPTYAVDGLENFYVPFIQELHSNSSCGRFDYPVLIDPTRAPENKPKKFYLFKPSELTMHHYSGVRKNYLRKLMNSSANVNWYDKIESLYEAHKNFKIGDSLPFNPNQTVKEVPNKFNIKEF